MLTPTQRARVIAFAQEQAALVVLAPEAPALLDPDYAWAAFIAAFPYESADPELNQLFERAFRHAMARRWVEATRLDEDASRGLVVALAGAVAATADGLVETVRALVADVRRSLAECVVGEHWL